MRASWWPVRNGRKRKRGAKGRRKVGGNKRIDFCSARRDPVGYHVIPRDPNAKPMTAFRKSSLIMNKKLTWNFFRIYSNSNFFYLIYREIVLKQFITFFCPIEKHLNQLKDGFRHKIHIPCRKMKNDQISKTLFHFH